MKTKELLRDLRYLDVSDCGYDAYYNKEKNCFCPLGKLATKKGVGLEGCQYGYEYSHEIINFLKKTYDINVSMYHSFFMAFTDAYDKEMHNKRGREKSKKKALKAFKEFIKKTYPNEEV